MKCGEAAPAASLGISYLGYTYPPPISFLGEEDYDYEFFLPQGIAGNYKVLACSLLVDLDEKQRHWQINVS